MRNIGFPKKPRGAPVCWGEVMAGVRQQRVSAETRSGKEVCVCFQDPPRNAEGARLRVGWQFRVGGRRIGVRA